MSIFGALNTAVSGLSAQSHAFTDISNNISNSQTTGYKATDTDFSDYVLNSTAAERTNGTVRATTASQNEAQGTITSTSNALALAVSGRGFFSVDEESGDSSSAAKVFQNTSYYTRNGDFSQNNLGYLVNSSNEYLNGYMVDAKGVLDTKNLQTLNVANVAFRPTETGTVSVAASLPGTAPVGDTTAATTQTAQVYDSTGAEHDLKIGWTQSATSPSSWTVTATTDNGTTSTAQATFDSTGALSSLTQDGTTTSIGGSNASFSVPATFGGVSQPIKISLGSIGSTSGTTMALASTNAGTATTPTTDSMTNGTFQGITMTADGNVMATFSNSQTQVSQLVAKVPLATFADANALSAHDGQAYTATAQSGAATFNLAGENGAGSLEASSIENSTTSLDTDLTKLITAQQAYGANAKVVTTANELLQTVLSMKQ